MSLNSSNYILSQSIEKVNRIKKQNFKVFKLNTDVFEKSKGHYKYLVFTHSETTDGEKNEKLIHNINPKEVDKKSYVRRGYFVDKKENFEPPHYEFRIHFDDWPLIKLLKSFFYKKEKRQ